jgi:archaetidylinositol phosphate synthase
MLEVYLRPIFQTFFVDPIARRFSHYSPALITYLACGFGLMVVPALMHNSPGLAVAFLLISGFLDTLDGTVARINNKTSTRGIILDIVSDRMVEVAVLIGLFVMDPSHRGLLTFFMLGSCYLYLTTFLVSDIFSPARAEKGFQYSPGATERAEAFVLFVMMIWMPHYFTTLAWIFTGLVLLSSYNRMNQLLNNTVTIGERR